MKIVHSGDRGIQRVPTCHSAERPRIDTRTVRGKWFFLSAFVFSCGLFWWLPSILFRIIVHQVDGVENETLVISICALGLFILGYLLPITNRVSRDLSETTLAACGNFSYWITVLLFFPSLLLAAQDWHSRIGVEYGEIGAIPLEFQVVLYTQLFFGFMFIGAASLENRGWRRLATAAVLVTVPRLIVSLHGGRFFLAQAVVPALLIAVGRGWIRLSVRRILQIALLALVILFVPAITRGDSIVGDGDISQWFAGGGTLKLYQDNIDYDLESYCTPFLVSFTAKVIPYAVLGSCLIDFGDRKNEPQTLDRILAVNTPGSLNGKFGPGSNYLLDLHLFGGLPAVFLGSVLFGLTCRSFVFWINSRSLFSGIWAECLTRALFAPRDNLGYVYERIPSLILTTCLVIVAVALWRIVCQNQLTFSKDEKMGLI